MKDAGQTHLLTILFMCITLHRKKAIRFLRSINLRCTRQIDIPLKNAVCAAQRSSYCHRCGIYFNVSMSAAHFVTMSSFTVTERL